MSAAHPSLRGSDAVSKFVFGPLTITTRGMGVFIPTEKFRERFAPFTAEQLREINREAWKQRKAAERTANRHNNVTIHGWSTYESAYMHEQVAKAVCSASWAAIARGAS